MLKADEMIAKIPDKKKLDYEDNDEEDKTLPKTKTGRVTLCFCCLCI